MITASVQIVLFSEVFSQPKSDSSIELPSGDEGYQRGFQATGADGLSLSRLPADVAVLAAGSFQEAALWRYRQPVGQVAAEPGLPEDHCRF